MTVGLHIEMQQNGDKRILRLEGQLDVMTAPALVDAVTQLIEGEHRKILLDCAKVEAISPHAIKALLTLSKTVKNHRGLLVFFNCEPGFLHVLEQCKGAEKLLLFHDEKEASEAVAAIAS